ncbi:MAG: GTPase HflX [Flavobacteriales bacterium]
MGFEFDEHKKERVVLVGVITQKQNETISKEYLDELEFLAYTAGAETLKRFQQRVDKPNPKTYIGTGKLDEIGVFAKENNVDTVIFDDELSGSQIRNIETILDCKILDRNNLILDIFAGRAQTSHAVTQVELAQYQYLLPRLTRMWTHLQKQKGGIGMKGPGETEIETDRRIIREKINVLRKKLVTIDKQMATQRKNRGQMIRAALIGYTNVGKSTLMNVLSKSNVLEENKLFATLDTTVRKVVINNLPFLLTDTVGFIRKLPTQLVESFKSTLDEVREADYLIHVVDVAHESFEEHIESVNGILKDINAQDKPTLMVFNKTDLFTFTPKDEDDLTPVLRENLSLDYFKDNYERQSDFECIFISARDREDIHKLRDKMYKEIKEIHAKRFPYNNFLY